MNSRINTYQSYFWEYKSQCSQDRYVVSLFCYVVYYYLDGGELFMQTDNLGSIRRIYGKTGSTVFE